jgi:hypothetical protein
MGRWALLGLLLGLAMTVRWQNALLVLFPGADWLSRAWNAQRAGAGRAESPSIARAVVVFGACALAGFLPQMLAWQAIYGTPLAVSPLSPKMLWAQPAVGRLLWSSNNGLFSTSPVTYVAALGLLLLPRRDRLFGWSALGVMTLAIYVNASVEDWWAGASYGARRFDGVVPLFVVGLGLAAGHLAALVARRPAFAVNFLLLAFVAWNLTFMAAGRTGGERLLPPLSFGAMSARQAEVLHGWIGHPFSYPASLWFSARTGLAPGRYDRLSAEFLSDASRPYGKIDIGGNDEDHLLGGWHGIETDPDGTTWRWTSDASTLLVPLDHPAPLLLQARIVPFTYSTSPDVSVGARVNGRRYGPIRVPAGGWQRIEIPVEARAWKAGVNVVEWLWMNAAAPSTVGLGADTRVLGARVDFVRVEVAR